MFIAFLMSVKYMLFMTSYIFVTKPHEFHGDLVTGEEVANSKFFKLSEA
jgi:hypothetical protein